MVEDLFEDMKDGVKLLALLEVLSGQKLVRIFSMTRLIEFFPSGIGGGGVGSGRDSAHIR